MNKGMLSGLWSLKWVLLCLLLTGCPKSDPPTPTPTPIPPPPSPSPEITVTGQVMLGPVVAGHSLQLVIYDPDMKEIDRPKIGLDGSYGFTLKDYEGAVIAQVTSTNPQQECSVGDYIDEATAKPKCLGKNSILSSTVLKLDSTSNENQAKLHTTSVTTIAALNAGISINEDGTMAVDDNLSPEIIDQSNKIIAQALGLGDQSVAEYTPKSIITTDQKFQTGDAYSQALAEISGIEAEGKSLNSIVKLISAGIEKNGKLSPAVQDMMVKGNQQVFTTAKEQGADTSILNQINKRQDTHPDSIFIVDMVIAPEPPVFTNKTKTKTSKQKITWEWISGGTGNNRYQYRFGAEDDIQNVRGWTETSSNRFTSKDNLKPGKYILEIQEGHTSKQTVWSPASNKIIEIVENQKGSVAIQGEAIQGKMLLAVPNDKDGILRAVEYQWYRENQPIINATDSEYALTEDDVNTAIMVKVSYIDNIDYAERDIQSAPVKVDNIDDKPVLNKLDDIVLKEDAAKQVIALVANDIDNDDKAITYDVDSNNSEIAKVTLTANNELQITPMPNKHGTSTITVTAISNGLKDEKTFNIIIKNTDDKPVLNKLDNVLLKEDAARHVIALVAYDIDNEDKAITYDVDSNNSEIAKVTITANNELQITPIPNKHGTATITVIAKSNNQTATKVFNLNIENINDQPLITSSAENEAEEGKKYSYQVKIEDSDKNSTAKYSLIAKPNGMVINKVGLITWIPENKDRNYTADVTVEVDDSSGASNATTQQEFIITVKANDDKPVLNKLDNVLLKEDAARHVIALVAYDIDNEDKAITYDVDSNNSEIAKVTITANNELQITPIPNKHGTATITVIAKSNNQTATKVFNLNIENINDQPLITSSAENEAEEGKKYSYQVKIEDSDKNSTAKYSLIAKPNGMVINKVGLITWIPENKDRNYTADVTVEVDDSSGASNATTQQEFIITVKANDDKPVLNKLDNVLLKEDAARHVIALVAYDIDNEDKAITYDVDSNNSEIAKVTITANNELQITPIPNKHGTATITVIAKSNNQTATKVFNLNIENINDQPLITSSAENEAEEGKKYSYQVKIEDSDKNSTAKYSLIAKPNGMVINKVGLITWIPENKDRNYTADVTVEVDDSSGASNATTQQEFIITVKANDDKPVLNKLDNVLLKEDAARHVIALVAYDIDNEDKAITYDVDSNNSEIAKVTITANNELQITPIPNKHGTATITVIAKSNNQTATTAFNLKIENTDDAPTLISGKSIILGLPKQGQTLTADPTVISDADGIVKNSYTYEWNADDEPLTGKTDKSIALTQAHVGKKISVKVSYTDSYGEDYIKSHKTLDVKNTNDQPKINSDPKLKAEEDKQYTYQLEVTDADKDSQAKYKLVRQQNASTMKISNEGLITWIPENKASDYTANVSVEVDDSSGESNATTQQEFIITVKAIDDKPVLNKLDNVLLKEDAARHVIALVAYDIDNEDKAITYDVDSNNSEIAKVTITANNELQITPIPNKHGTATITVIAKSNNQTATTAFNLKIENTDDAPTLISGKSIILGLPKQGQTLTADPTVISDADGIVKNSYTYEWNADDEPLTGKTDKSIALTQAHVGKKISVKVSYTDSYGEDYIKSHKTLDVKNTNDQPKINSDPKLKAEEDKQYTYQLEVTDADKDSQAKYKLVRQQNASTMKISNEGLITWIPENKASDYTANVSVEVDDSSGESNATTQQEFIITVKAIDDAPILNTILSPIKVDEDNGGIEITLDTTDIDNENTAITYQATSSENDIATVEIKNVNKLYIRPVKNEHGEVTITVTAISNEKKVEKDFQLIIKNKNDEPTGKVTIKSSNQLHRKFLANADNISDPDGIKSYSYQWSTGNSEIRGAVQKEFTLTDEEIGEQITVKVTIEDDLGNKTSFISKQTPKIKANGIPPTVKGAIEMGAQLKDGGFDINKTLSDANLISQFYNSSTPLTYVITALPSRGVIINNDGSEITKIENGEYQEVPKGFKYKRTQAGKDSFEYKGKRENILSLKPATINISYKNNAPNVSSFKISAAVETETRSIPFSENITDDQDAIESIIITDPPQLGSLYINGEILDASKLETLIDINSNVTYKSRDILNSSDSFKYKAIDTDDMRSFEGSVRIEFKNNDKAPKINKEPTQTDLMIDEAGKQISFKFKITDSSSFKAYEPLFLSTKGNTSQPLWISINTDKQSDSPVNYTVNATLNDKSYANDSIRVLIPVVDDLGLKSKYAFVINPELSVDTQNKFIQKNNTTWVDVCWQFSEKTANLDSTKITEIKQEIMNTISDSWEKHSALKFDWREDDWDAIQDGKGQLFKWDSPSNCAENYTAEYAQVKVYIKQKEEVESKQAENRFTINLNVKADGSFEDAYPKHKIIHEFGHALGFPDEDKRFDTFRSPSSQVSQYSCNDIMVVYNPKDENQNIAKNSVKKITHTKWQKQLFNSFSIMNECVFSNSEIMKQYDFGTLISGSKLGFNDINRLQYFYGAPATAETSHLMKADQFVTGLYLDANDYEYYENGIANSSYSPIEKSNLQTILSSNLHFSITNNVRSIGKTKTVLFKHEATTVDYPEFIPRETSPVAACEETGTNSQDENNQQKIQFDLNCDTIESVATHKQITEERSIYYKADSLLAIQMYYCKTKKEDTTTFKEQFTDKDVCLDLTDNFAVTLSTNNTHNLFSNGKKEFVFWLIETNQ